MTQLGVDGWALAWLAFLELGGSVDHTADQLVALRSRGWFEHLGFFGSTRDRVRERVASSPYFLAVAYAVGGDLSVAGGYPNIPPEDMIKVLEKRRKTDAASLFPSARVDEAIAQFNADMGLDAMRRGKNPVAIQRLTLAAELGNALAQATLGRMYAEGVSAPQDRFLAHKWLNLAVYRLSGTGRDDARDLRKRVTKALSQERRMEAETIVREWVPKSWAELTRLDPGANEAAIV